MARQRRFVTAGVTAPDADAKPPKKDVSTSRRQDAKTSASNQPRTAFTWRLTPDVATRMDMLVLRLRADLGKSRLDRATMLEALLEVAEGQAIYGALLAKLQEDEQE